MLHHGHSPYPPGVTLRDLERHFGEPLPYVECDTCRRTDTQNVTRCDDCGETQCDACHGDPRAADCKACRAAAYAREEAEEDAREQAEADAVAESIELQREGMRRP